MQTRRLASGEAFVRLRSIPPPGGLAERVTKAVRRFERESGPYRARAGMSRESQHRADRLLSKHPIGALLPWLALFGPAVQAGDGSESGE